MSIAIPHKKLPPGVDLHTGYCVVYAADLQALETAKDLYEAAIQKLMAENAHLRERLQHIREAFERDA